MVILTARYFFRAPLFFGYYVSWPKNCFPSQDFLRDHPSSFSFFHTLASFSVITFVILWLLRQLPNVFSLILFSSSSFEKFNFSCQTHMCHLCTFVAFDFGTARLLRKYFILISISWNVLHKSQIFLIWYVTHIIYFSVRCDMILIQ